MTAVLSEEAVECSPAPASRLERWRCCAQAPGVITHADQLDNEHGWVEAVVPGTVGSALAAAGRWNFENPTDIDASDWWFQTTFSADSVGRPSVLRFDGLATLAEVWLNGELVLRSDNMFRRYQVDVSSRVQTENELVIGFRSLTEDSKRKRPRPRWKTNLVSNQQLRWYRTTLQGRIPGWSPPVPAIGPWRHVTLETGPILVDDLHLTSRLEGTCGVASIAARISASSPVQRAFVRVGKVLTPLSVVVDNGQISVSGEVRIADARKWWPHTHGKPSLYECELVLETEEGQHLLDCPSIGFRDIKAVTNAGFEIRVNDQPVYCRGACWTVGDVLNLTGTEESLRHDLMLAAKAGVNMLRVGGTMVYESDAFYRLCDELGIMVWQDFMFANMDYPVDDPAFLRNLHQEASEQVTRLASHPCLAVYCGNSEVEQQAAMLGMPREVWSNSWFAKELPAICAQSHPGCIYVPSTPTGGVLPFQPDQGLTHYYGVGAYLRPATDIRRSDVKFTPETLGFSNIPDAPTIEAVTGSATPITHDPRWKRRVPRDTGAGWDFEDVRDHYLRELFNVDPIQLRSSDMPRYLQLSRLVPGEMMTQAFSEWRSGHSRNRGALVWFYKDLWPGAGWGIIDSNGIPKATYYYLKRSWSSRQLTLTDEGLNGIHVHLVNESNLNCEGTVEITLLKEPNIVVARKEVSLSLEGRSQRQFSADEILGGFYDVSYAYRFGPPHHDVVVATWFDTDRNVISEAFHFIRRSQPARVPLPTLETSVERVSDSEYRVGIQSDRFLHSLQLTARGFLPDDNYFHLAPQRSKCISFHAVAKQAPAFKTTVEALNLESSHTVSFRSKTS